MGRYTVVSFSKMKNKSKSCPKANYIATQKQNKFLAMIFKGNYTKKIQSIHFLTVV